MFEHGDIVGFNRDGQEFTGAVWDTISDTDLYEVMVGGKPYSVAEDDLYSLES